MTDARESKAVRLVPHRGVLVAIFVVYVLTRYPDVGGRVNMGDSAKFQLLARTLGIGHSPGNPLYLMVSALWVRLPLPFADATKVTLLSGLAGLATLELVSRAVSRFALPPLDLGLRKQPLALEARSFAAILLGLGSLFWTFSTEAEVYTFGSMFAAGALLGMAQWTTAHEPRGLYLAIGSLGFGLGNHLTISALAPAVLYVLLREKEGRDALRSVRFWAVAAGALALGVLSYGWIAWRLTHPPLAYSELPGPFEWTRFLRFVTAKTVMKDCAAPVTYAGVLLERVPDVAHQLQKQWAWPLLVFLPFGVLQLFQTQKPFAIFIALGALGHVALAIVFRIPDPEGLFASVAVLLVVPLAFAPSSSRATGAMLLLQGAFAVAHVVHWYREPLAAYVQQTPEGKVVVNLPTLHESVPEHAMVGVPCGHYGCVEVTSYYALVEPSLRAKHVDFVRFSWSEWNDEKLPVPLVDPATKQSRPICALVTNDVANLTKLGLTSTAIPRAPIRALGRRYESPPLHCFYP